MVEAREFTWAIHKDACEEAEKEQNEETFQGFAFHSFRFSLRGTNSTTKGFVPAIHAAWLFEGLALSIGGLFSSIKDEERHKVVFSRACASACVDVIGEDLEAEREDHARRVFNLAVVGLLTQPEVYPTLTQCWRCSAWFAGFNLLKLQCLRDRYTKSSTTLVHVHCRDRTFMAKTSTRCCDLILGGVPNSPV